MKLFGRAALFAYESMPAGSQPGRRTNCPVADAIEELEHVKDATAAEEWRDVIVFLPL